MRDGAIKLLSFPLGMRSLANEMCLEGNELDEEQYPALVKKYQGERNALAGKAAQPDKPKISTFTRTLPNITYGNEPLLVTKPVTALGELLEAACEAEIVLAAAREALHHANAAFCEKGNAAAQAWQQFNQALMASLPPDTDIRGVTQVS